MQIVIPMSGFGERFRKAGYTIPKPLIEVEGKPIIAHVIDMFPGEKNFLFIARENSYVRNLEDALERIESGNFGVCSLCGELIPEERMIEVPNATKCVDCKTKDKLNIK